MYETFVAELGRRLAGMLADAIQGDREFASISGSVSSDFSSALSRHLVFVSNWSERDQLYGLGRARDVDTDTLPLDLTETARRFRGSEQPSITYSEEEILTRPGNILLLGDPGAGKTTTIKRLCRKVLTDHPLGDTDVSQYPLVLVLRNADLSDGLHEEIYRTLGLPQFDGRRHLELDSETNLGNNSPELDEDEQASEDRQPIRSHRAVLYDALNATGALVFLDGLDEIRADLLRRVRREISDLALHLHTAKLVVSCRSGAYVQSIDGLDTFEICPLTEEQARQLSVTIVRDIDDFWDKIASAGVRDQADRPLLLIQLAILYANTKRLPDRPAEISQRVVELLLHRWDEERALVRISQYSRFTPEAKQRFLSSVAHELTIKSRSKSFDSRDLQLAYMRVRDKFGLPAGEAQQVVSEIESHTGLIVASGAGYEFSHLSLQEYLCGDYLARSPFGHTIPKYLARYPDPVAVAVSISSDPDRFFAGLVFRTGNKTPWASLSAFLSRIAIESPQLTGDELVGIAFLKLVSHPEARPTDTLIRFMHVGGVRSGIDRALDRYRLRISADQDDRQGTIRLRPGRDMHQLEGLTLPRHIRLSQSLLTSLGLEAKRAQRI